MFTGTVYLNIMLKLGMSRREWELRLEMFVAVWQGSMSSKGIKQ